MTRQGAEPAATVGPQGATGRRTRLALTLAGAAALCLSWGSWRDLPHVFYDVPSALAMAAFVSGLVCDGAAGRRPARWWAKLAALGPVAIITAGRVCLGWPISGHLTGILAVALIQTTDARLSVPERAAYWAPLPIILYVRLAVFDAPGHRETLSALASALGVFAFYLAVVAVLARRWSEARTGRRDPEVAARDRP